MAQPQVAILDYGSGNLRSAERALEHVGADVVLTSDPKVAVAADGLLVPGVGAYAACMKGLREVYGPRIIGERLAGGRPVMGICVGMQVLFDGGVEYSDGAHADSATGCGEWPGTVERLDAKVLPHMGWNTLEIPPGSAMFEGVEPNDRVYFVHSYAAQSWDLPADDHLTPPLVTWATHEDCRFVAAVENGPLWAAQFHPEKSARVGAKILRNWVDTL